MHNAQTTQMAERHIWQINRTTNGDMETQTAHHSTPVAAHTLSGILCTSILLPSLPLVDGGLARTALARLRFGSLATKLSHVLARNAFSAVRAQARLARLASPSPCLDDALTIPIFVACLVELECNLVAALRDGGVFPLLAERPPPRFARLSPITDALKKYAIFKHSRAPTRGATDA